MKTYRVLLTVCGCACAFGSLAVAQNPTPPRNPPDPGKSALPPAPTAALPPGSKPSAGARAASAPSTTDEKTKEAAAPSAKLPESVAESKAAEKAAAEHIRPRTPIAMKTPPPAPRAEKATPAPTTGSTWVPGYWGPVNGTWQWTAGEWRRPATPASVWVEPGYDTKTRTWTAGYWQPDREGAYEPAPSEPAKSEKPSAK